MNHEWRSDGDESLAREVTHWLATDPNTIPAIIDQLRLTPSHAQQTSYGDGLPIEVHALVAARRAGHKLDSADATGRPEACPPGSLSTQQPAPEPAE